jgi:flagellar motor protein MotB
MSATRIPASTLHLQMGQEVIYLLLVTSLIANFVLATLALRSSKQASDLSAARPYSELLNENRKLRQEQTQLQDQIKNLQAALDQAHAELAKLNQRGLQDQPPIITLREADGFSFSPGSAEISPDFLEKLALEVVPELTALSKNYRAQIVEVIGHTDGKSLRDTLRLKANLDDSLGQYLDPTSTAILVPYDNVGLGIARAVSVARALRTSGLPADLDIQPLSAASLISPDDHTNPAPRVSDPMRRRIEIRIRRINAN